MNKPLCTAVYSSSHDTCCGSCYKSSRAMEPHKTVWLPCLLSNTATRSQREFTLHTTRWHQHINDIICLWSHHMGLLSFAGENIPGDLRLHTFIKYFTQILTSHAHKPTRKNVCAGRAALLQNWAHSLPNIRLVIVSQIMNHFKSLWERDYPEMCDLSKRAGSF